MQVKLQFLSAVYGFITFHETIGHIFLIISKYNTNLPLASKVKIAHESYLGIFHDWD